MIVDPKAEANEAHRFACECEHVARMATDGDRAKFLASVAEHRGQEAADQLRRGAWAMMKQRRAA